MYSFSYLEPVCCSMSSSNCCFLTCIYVSQEAGQVVWSSHLFQDCPQFIVVHTVKGFGIVNKAEIDVFLGLVLFRWYSECWQFDIWFLCLFQNQLEHLGVHGSCIVEAGLKNFEHYFASMWDECYCAVVWAFFGIAFLWDWNENWLSSPVTTAESSRFADIVNTTPWWHHPLEFLVTLPEFYCIH